MSDPESSSMVYVVLTLAEACQKLVDDTVEGKLSVSELIQLLRDSRLNAAEVHDHVEEAQQRIHLQIAKSRQPNLPSREPLPSRGSGTETTGDSQARATEEAAWEALRAKFEQAATSSVSTPTITIDQLAKLLGEPKKPVGSTLVPQSLLSAVPHLALLQGKTADDPYIAKTWYLRQQYAKEKVVDSLINLGQSQALKDPISRAMWKLVILDHFVDLKKLYATLNKGYDHNDEPKDFMGGFSLVKKDFTSAKKPVRTESDWTHAFDAWMAGVILFYPHREDELSKYQSKIVDFCQHIPNGAPIAICFDADTRDCYARNPFRMDEDHKLHVPFLAQLLSSASNSVGTKWSASYHQSPHKRLVAVCQNWNLGICSLDSCPGGRCHNICCECNGTHKARDVEECFKKLNL
ncbi:hypothetical protein J132_03477 [Termitomyces sp. J132]|nr:hypothetical protein J132_03477 [Termitomyces sp. J132]